MTIMLNEFELIVLATVVFVLHFLRKGLKDVREMKSRHTVSSPEKKEAYGEPFVVRPDEYRVEQEQKKEEIEEEGFEPISEFVKKIPK